MPIKLPPIPDEAIRATVQCDHCWAQREKQPFRDSYALQRRDLERAWPYLYALAVRHAATTK